jgi:hypothetical protein
MNTAMNVTNTVSSVFRVVNHSVSGALAHPAIEPTDE